MTRKKPPTGREVHGTRYDTGPTISVVVGDYAAGWNDGVFAGDDELVTWARTLAAHQTPVRAFGRDWTADATTAAGALAALASYSPGRAIVNDAPNDLLDLLVREDALADSIASARAFHEALADADAAVLDEVNTARAAAGLEPLPSAPGTPIA